MSISKPEFPASKIFDVIKEQLGSDEVFKKKAIKQVNCIVAFNLKNKEGDTSSWFIDLKKSGEIGQGATASAGPADVSLNLSDEHFSQLVNGKANAQKLFMSGKLKVKGNVMKAAGIEGVLKQAKAKL
ncbi:sterol-binding-like protein [Nadsonia fulvescens var. elongata DSM 6958]|uniref:Sterol-binding-like protein n=1 Tax=Nadsonia fulvescens var. elongata DSM 6958 TaxID=857566 RepID=A0A1E3PLG9_9ASCO|nr:sterol-binding-like protein [Nadsonia fulvescens var. elongata DSM 6958]